MSNIIYRTLQKHLTKLDKMRHGGAADPSRIATLKVRAEAETDAGIRRMLESEIAKMEKRKPKTSSNNIAQSTAQRLYDLLSEAHAVMSDTPMYTSGRATKNAEPKVKAPRKTTTKAKTAARKTTKTARR